MYLGDGGRGLPLYLDGSGEVAQNSRGSVGFMVPALSKEATARAQATVVEEVEPSPKKAKGKTAKK